MSERITRVEDKIGAVDEKLEKIVERLSSIDTTLAVNTEQLKVHIRRTELLEEAVEPVKKHVAMVENSFKLIGIICSLAAFLLGVAKLIF
jgi:archaellum component FlaC